MGHGKLAYLYNSHWGRNLLKTLLSFSGPGGSVGEVVGKIMLVI